MFSLTKFDQCTKDKKHPLFSVDCEVSDQESTNTSPNRDKSKKSDSRHHINHVSKCVKTRLKVICTRGGGRSAP